MENELNNLSYNIYKVRRHMKQSQEEFAFNCGFSVRTLSSIETVAMEDIKLSTLLKISAHTKISICDLLSDNLELE